MTDTREPDIAPARDAILASEPGRVTDADAEMWTAVHRIGRALRSTDPSLESTLDAVLSTAVAMVPNTDAAGIILIVRGRFIPQAVLGHAPTELDAEQQRIGEGPCHAAAQEQTVIRIDDTVTDPRWPTVLRMAASMGVRGMACLPIWIDDQRLGALSLYSSVSGYRDNDIQVATLLATHAAVAIADAQRTENLRRAIVNRDLIGQAKGILMERFRLTSDQAFERLASTSQALNRKLAEVAETLANTGELPTR